METDNLTINITILRDLTGSLSRDLSQFYLKLCVQKFVVYVTYVNLICVAYMVVHFYVPTTQ